MRLLGSIPEPFAKPEAHTSAPRFIGHPAEQRGGIGRVEIIARRREREAAIVGRIKLHTAYLAREMGWNIEIVCRFLDQNSGGANARARLGFGFNDQNV